MNEDIVHLGDILITVSYTHLWKAFSSLSLSFISSISISKAEVITQPKNLLSKTSHLKKPFDLLELPSVNLYQQSWVHIYLEVGLAQL